MLPGGAGLRGSGNGNGNIRVRKLCLYVHRNLFNKSKNTLEILFKLIFKKVNRKKSIMSASGIQLLLFSFYESRSYCGVKICTTIVNGQNDYGRLSHTIKRACRVLHSKRMPGFFLRRGCA